MTPVTPCLRCGHGLRSAASISLSGCCLHNPVWSPADVAGVLCQVWQGDESGGWKPGEKHGTESQSCTVVRLTDGRYGLLTEGEDYTGHGCQCDSATNAYGSLDELLSMGVVDDGAVQAIRAAIGMG